LFVRGFFWQMQWVWNTFLDEISWFHPLQNCIGLHEEKHRNYALTGYITFGIIWLLFLIYVENQCKIHVFGKSWPGLLISRVYVPLQLAAYKYILPEPVQHIIVWSRMGMP